MEEAFCCNAAKPAAGSVSIGILGFAATCSSTASVAIVVNVFASALTAAPSPVAKVIVERDKPATSAFGIKSPRSVVPHITAASQRI